MSSDPLPLTWRPSWRYDLLIVWLLRPLPPFADPQALASLTPKDPAPAPDTFWTAYHDASLSQVILALKQAYFHLGRVARNPKANVREDVLAFQYGRLVRHGLTVGFLMRETERIDWTTLADIWPEPHTLAQLSKTALIAYMRSPTAPVDWKMKVALWFNRVSNPDTFAYSPTLITDTAAEMASKRRRIEEDEEGENGP